MRQRQAYLVNATQPAEMPEVFGTVYGRFLSTRLFHLFLNQGVEHNRYDAHDQCAQKRSPEVINVKADVEKTEPAP